MRDDGDDDDARGSGLRRPPRRSSPARKRSTSYDGRESRVTFCRDVVQTTFYPTERAIREEPLDSGPRGGGAPSTSPGGAGRGRLLPGEAQVGELREHEREQRQLGLLEGGAARRRRAAGAGGDNVSDGLNPRGRGGWGGRRRGVGGLE
ncbi:hypothetical protein THAOC_11428 [Thalassiosira oceanica]|uniref:Uncharacterized protein n=1 Tax=Thalassiosira oceanica TaxID=159749 RepID=K0T2K6_THAOC|nr:hypothetical protein THAOC_11428 [Thalassiosira oceanica]|eukprot:EJK67521.1 hypothetical protein THAOC_11428 [Thalassiosira oceanica]